MRIHKKVIFLLVVVMSAAFGWVACETPAGRTAGQVVDDGTITAKVKAKLFDDDKLSVFSISVETFEGNVTLTGAVDSVANREQATMIARSVNGVKEVNNLLKLKNQ